MKKKVLSVLLSAAMVTGILAGCGGSAAQEAAPAAEEAVEEAAEEAEEAVEEEAEAAEEAVEEVAEEAEEVADEAEEAVEEVADEAADAAADVAGIAAPDTSDWTEADKIYAYSWDDDFQKKLDVVLDAYPEYKDYVEYINLGVASEESLELIDNAFDSDKYPSLIPADIGSAKYWTEDDDKTLDLRTIGFTDDMLANSYQYAKDFADFNGELKAVTWQSTAGSVFYRRDIANKVFGTDDPEAIQAKLADWDTFFETAEELKAAGYKIVSGPKDVYYAIINAHTQPWVTVAEDGTETLTLDDSVTTYIETAKKLYDGDYTNNTEMWDGDWAANMGNDGNVFCYFCCPWMIGVMQGNGAEDGNWGAVVGPQSYYWGGTYVSVGKDTNNPELAAFILYELTCDPEIGVAITNVTGDAVNNIAANDALANGAIAEDNNGLKFLGGQNPYETWADAATGIEQGAVTYADKYYEGYISDAANGYNAGTYATVDEAIAYIEEQSAQQLGIPAAE